LNTTDIDQPSSSILKPEDDFMDNTKAWKTTWVQVS
jgi:hypothetical protein